MTNLNNILKSRDITLPTKVHLVKAMIFPVVMDGTKMACSGSLVPHFVNNDYVAGEIIYGTVHACHEVLLWSQVTLCCKAM